MEIFTSKVDIWLLVILLVTILVSLVSTYMGVRRGNLKNYVAALIIFLIGVFMPAWVLLSTKYVVSEEELRVKAGPFSWSIPLTSISSVKDTRNSRSSPALSLDRIRISYGNGNSIMVSPRNKGKFKDAIGH